MSKDIRVLIIDLSKSYGGASVRALSLAYHLKPWGVAIAGLEDSPVIRIARERNIPVRIAGKRRTDLCIPFRLSKIIRKDHFQIIDTQNIQSKFWGSLSSLITGVAFVSTLNSSYEDEHGRSLKGKIYALIDHWTNFNTDRHIVVSRAIQNDLLQAGIPDARIDLITNAVEIDESLQIDDPNLTRKKIGIPEDAILCVAVGRLVWAKGYEDFIEAFTVVAARLSNSYAAIIGDGILYSSLLQQIHRAGLENRVRLLNQCDDNMKWSVLKAGNIFVMSSRSEGVPFALLEAAAVGLPILSTRCGGIPDIFMDKVDALLVPIGDPIAISSGIIQLAEDRQLAQRLGANAKVKIEQRYSLSAQMEAIRQAYTKALDHK